MRIAFATHPTAFQQPGGGEAVLLELRERLGRRGHDVELFDPWTKNLSGFEVLHYFSSIGTDLYPYVRRYVPLVVTPTIWPELPPGAQVRRDVRRRAGALLGRAWISPYEPADRLIVHTNIERDLLVRNYGARQERVIVVPHGVDERFAHPTDGSFARRHGLTRYAVCVGRLEPNKNQLQLIRALRNTGLELVIVGERAAGEDVYAAACQSEADETVHFVGPLSSASEELVDAIRCAAVLVVPSAYETWSLAAHEAGVAGTPIAASATPILRELLSPWATFFDPGVLLELRTATLAAAERGHSEEQSSAFLERVSWDRVAESIELVYRSVARRE